MDRFRLSARDASDQRLVIVAAAPALGYYWGDDDYGLERAADRLGARMEAAAGSPVERWRTRGNVRSEADLTQRMGEIGQRVGTAPFFGGGTLVIVTEPGVLARARDQRPTLLDLVASVAPGNGLAFVDPVDDFGKQSAAGAALGQAVVAAGGETREFKAPREAQMVRWIEERGSERGIRFGQGAAQELARRIGAFVREGDIDRRRQGRLAVSELDKLALYRPDREVSAEDVRAVVPEAIPGSIWALLDALAMRQTAQATVLVERLIQATPAPVLLAVIHRRIRELIQAADLISRGATPAELVRSLKMKPYPAEKLARQSKGWTMDELEAALEALLELDTAIKGSDGQLVSEGQVRLATTLWIAEHVPRRDRPRS